MKLSAKVAIVLTLLASTASAQFNAELAYLEAGPSVVASGGRLDVKLRITNTSSQAWEPLPAPDCHRFVRT